MIVITRGDPPQVGRFLMIVITRGFAVEEDVHFMDKDILKQLIDKFDKE